MPDKSLEPMLKQRDVQRWLNLSRRGVQNMTADGRLPAVRIGGKVLRYRRSDIEQQFRKP